MPESDAVSVLPGDPGWEPANVNVGRPRLCRRRPLFVVGKTISQIACLTNVESLPRVCVISSTRENIYSGRMKPIEINRDDSEFFVVPPVCWDVHGFSPLLGFRSVFSEHTTLTGNLGNALPPLQKKAPGKSLQEGHNARRQEIPR